MSNRPRRTNDAHARPRNAPVRAEVDRARPRMMTRTRADDDVLRDRVRRDDDVLRDRVRRNSGTETAIGQTGPRNFGRAKFVNRLRWLQNNTQPVAAENHFPVGSPVTAQPVTSLFAQPAHSTDIEKTSTAYP